MRKLFSVYQSSQILTLVVDSIVLAVLGTYLFATNAGWSLTSGLDGQYVAVNVIAQNLFRDGIALIGWNPLQGMGGTWYPFNALLYPAFNVALLVDSDLPPVSLTMCIFMLELFWSTWFLARSVGMSLSSARLGAWCAIVLMFPLVGASPIYSIFSLAPQVATWVSVANLVVGCCFRMNMKELRWLWGGGAIALLLWQIAAAPLLVLVMVPGTVVLALAVVLGWKNRANFISAAAMLLVAVAVFFLPLEFIRGLAAYSAFSMFPGAFESVNHSLTSGSIIFHYAQGSAGPLLFVLAAFGAACSMRFNTGPACAFAGLALVSMALIVIATIAVSIWPNKWSGPNVVYFEFVLWPTYALLAVNGILLLVDRVRHNYLSGKVMSQASVFGIVCVLLFFSPSENAAAVPWPPKGTPITAELEARIGLKPGASFKGRVANITGVDMTANYLWFPQHSHDHALWQRVGNDMRLVGLWFFGIPTFEEYSSTYSPALYVIARGLQGWDGPKPFRSILTVGNANSRIMSMLGVNYVLSQSDVTNAERVLEIETDGLESIGLYHFPMANISGVGVTSVERVDDARVLVRKLFDPKNDLRSVAYVKEDIQSGLSPVTETQIVVERNGLTVTAASEGRSLLVIPFEFSHCFKITNSLTPIRIMRANLLNTAIEFSDRLNIHLTFEYGLFSNTRCRQQDAADLSEIRLNNATTMGSLEKR